jgi:hypothetical protein
MQDLFTTRLGREGTLDGVDLAANTAHAGQ